MLVICHFWYNWLDKRFPGKAFKIIAKKLMVDQMCFSPFLIAVFFGTVGVLESMRYLYKIFDILENVFD